MRIYKRRLHLACFESLEDRRLLAVVGNNLAVGAELQVYRIAIAATAEYTAMFADGSDNGVDKAFESIETLVADLNSIYTPELAIQFDLVSDNSIVFSNAATDGYTNSSLSTMLGENQTKLNTVLGSAAYDLGHVLGHVSGGASGLATLSTVGKTNVKARGASNVSSPAAEWVSLIAHEIGHQFSAEHTFNGADGFCTPANWSPGTANEPGSGSSIMSYYGSCEDDNLPGFEDLMFHATSFEEIQTYIDNTPAAAPNSTPSNGGNQVPTIDAGANYTIPAQTPFELSAVGADADVGDPVLYAWDQIDQWQQQNIGVGWTDDGQSPLFRSYSPSLTPNRTFPRLSDLLAGNEPRINGELLPTTDRDLNFRVTVRDERGGVNSDDVRIEVRDTGTPFAVTAPATPVTWAGGSQQTISWNVADTNLNDINVASVDILLSVDGGLTFPLLLETTANDGSAMVTVPNIATSQARIKIQPVGNVFFAINNTDLVITGSAAAAGLDVTPSAGWGELVEGGSSKSYAVQLNTDPLGVVQVRIDGSPQTVLSLDGRQFDDFVTLNLSSTTPQTIHVRATSDFHPEGPTQQTLVHSITSSTSVSYPSAMPLTPLSTVITDQQRPPVIGVDLDFSTTTGAPKSWNSGNLSGLTTSFSNLIRDDGLPTSVDLSIALAGGGSIGAGFDRITEGSKPRHVPSLDGIHAYNRSSQALTATWSDLVPGNSYGVYIFGSDSGSNNVSQTITMTGETGSTSSFTQTLVGGVLMVNGEDGDRTRSLESFEETIIADAAGEITVTIAADVGTTWVSLAGLAIRALPTIDRAVIDRRVFYNDSVFDGNDAGANTADDDAIAIDKAPLFSGTANFANYTSFDKGINGLLVDVMDLPGPIGASDFEFLVGNSSDTSSWTVPTAPTVTLRDDEGTGGADRVTLVWPAGEIKDQWIRVTVKANGNTGLDAPDVFFFGNLAGDTGNSASTAAVDFADVQLLFGALGGVVPIDSHFDMNRDGLVTFADVPATNTPPFRTLELISILNNAVATSPRVTPPTDAPTAINPPTPTEETDADSPNTLDKLAIDHLLSKSNRWLSRRRARAFV